MGLLAARERQDSGGIAKGFKKAMEPYLPHELLYRPKMGFGCPIDHWRSDLKEMAHDVLLSDRAAARGIVKRDYVARMLEEHLAGTNLHHTRLWAAEPRALVPDVGRSIDEAALERPSHAEARPALVA